MAAMVLFGLIAAGACSNEAPSDASDPKTVGDAGGNPLPTDVIGVDTGPRFPMECLQDEDCLGRVAAQPPCRPAICWDHRCEVGLPAGPTACDDGDGCTVGDTCADGACLPGTATVCEDDNPCTADHCAHDSGACVFEAVDTPCEVSGTCAVGVCHGGACTWSSALFAQELPAPQSQLAVAMAWLDSGQLALLAEVALPAAATGVVWMRASLDGALGISLPLPLQHAGGMAAGPGGVTAVAGERRAQAGDQNGALVAVTAGGTIAWERELGGKQDERLRAICHRGKGGWFAAGQTHSKGQGAGDIWFLRLSETGAPLLDWSYGSAQAEEASAVTATDDGGALIAGRQIAPDGSVKALMLRAAADASLLWYSGYGGPGEEWPAAVGMRPDGGAWMAGTRQAASGAQVAWIVAVDEGGKVLWEKLESGPGRALGLGATGDGAGGLLVVGAQALTDPPEGPWKARAAAYDPQGKPSWTRTYLPLADARLVATVRTAGGAFLFGHRRLGDLHRLLLLRVDANGWETCDLGGACDAKALADCDDGQSCTIDACHATLGCSHQPVGDGSLCPGGACTAGKCAP